MITQITTNETTFLVWTLGTLLAILAFIGALGVNAIIKMARDLGEIKTTIAKIDEKHNTFESTVKRHDKRIEKIENKLFI
jgi:septal ring factor EnvC (AmiA/AmiB activator)